MSRFIFDIEANGLLNEPDPRINATRIHCLCWYNIDTRESGACRSESEITNWFFDSGKDLVLVGHKVITYDIPLLEKLLGLDLSKDRKIDTLGLSWYLYPQRIKHGLDEWGEDLGIKKPVVTDWQGLSEENWIKLELGITEHSPQEQIDEYWQLVKERDIFIAQMVYRCSEDVKINTKLFNLQLEYLKKIYNNDLAAIGRFMDYISFKLDCAREQQEVKFRLDVPKATENLVFLEGEKKKKIDILSEIMPPSHTYKIKAKPKALFKADGSISSHGQKWFDLLKSQGLPEHHNMSLKLIDKTNKGNPGSHQQLKDWLFKLGWKPTTFKYVKEDAKDGETYTAMNKQTTRAVPQLSADDGSGICLSVKELYEVHPELVELEDMFIINHRISKLKGFLEKVDSNGFLKAEIAGLTNTLRFQHSKPIVNLPTIPKKYWELIRGCLIAPDDNHVLCGSDMSGLEDNCKQHYMYFFDPQYVTELRTEGFDPHLDIAVLGGLLTHEQGEEHKLYEKTKGQQGKSYKAVRLKAKKTNFAAVYGAGAPKIALTANIPLKEATLLHHTYWKRNKAVKQVAESAIKKTVDNNMWLYNPVSRFWYSLRFEKDAFSTLNQGTGVYCFDTWVKYVRQQGIRIAMQYHDEICFPALKQKKEVVEIALNRAITWVNNEIKLNVPLGISIEFGDTYAAIH